MIGKKFLVRLNIIIGLLLFLFFPMLVGAEDLPLNAYFFYGDGCPHCAREAKFLQNDLKAEFSNLNVYNYEIYNNRQNALLLQKIATELGVAVDGVPFLVIGNQPIAGYADGMTSRAIRNLVSECSSYYCVDSVAILAGVPVPDNTVDFTPVANNLEEMTQDQAGLSSSNNFIHLPLLGEVAVADFSLPILTIIMGTLDGFNPCAMWVLIFLISLLLGMQNRRRMWLLGIVFIIASASVYFLFMAAWLNLILFLGVVIWVRLIIGLLAIGGGAFSLKEFFVNKQGVCKVTGTEKRQKVFEKLKLTVQQNSLWIALGGIIVLAFAVNLVELICSAGLPTVYTQVLALSELPTIKYYLYILLYIFFFMIDDLLVFFVAMITLQMTGLTSKYARWARLIGGLILVIVGLLLWFKPEWLMFG